jgi:tetratricopeptide (TPR) repeat protein
MQMVQIKNLLVIVQSVAIILVFSSLSAQKNLTFWYKALAALENEKVGEGLLWLDSAIAHNQKNVMFYSKKGEVLTLQGRYTEALLEFNAAEYIKPGTSSLAMAKAYAGMGNNEMALAELKRHLEGNAKEPEAKILLSPFFEKLSKTDEWRELWKKDWYSPNERFQAEVEYFLARQRWDDALDMLNKRLEKGRGSHWLFALRGEAYYGLGSFKSAEADYSEAIKRSKRNSNYFVGRAKTRIKLLQYKAALRDVNIAMDLNAGDPKCLTIKAEALKGMSKAEEAAENLKLYLSFYPNDIYALRLLALNAFESSAYLDALFALSKVINSGKADASCYELRGLIYIKSNSWEFAQSDFLNAISKDPKRAKTYGLLGDVQIKLGNATDGCISIKKSMDLGYFPAQELYYKHCKK